MGDLAAYAFELTQPDAEALYTHVDVGFEDHTADKDAYSRRRGRFRQCRVFTDLIEDCLY